MSEFFFTGSPMGVNSGVRRVAIKQISWQESVEHDGMAAYYRNLSADERIRDFLVLQKTLLCAMGYKTFPQVERMIRFRKMK